MIQVDPLPLCFQPSELFEEEEEEQPAQISQVLFELDCNKLQAPLQVLNDPSAGRQNDERDQRFSPLAGCKA